MPNDAATIIRDYLRTLYTVTNGDANPLIMRNLNASTLTDKTVAMRELKVSAAVENR